MKTKLIMMTALIMAVSNLPVMAAISVEHSTSNEYIINNGYSVSTAEAIDINKARANGREYYTPDETAFEHGNPIVRFIRKFYVYADPAAEDYSFYHHSTKTTPGYKDL